VFGLAGLLQSIPDEFKPMAALGIGAVILVALVLFHGAGLHRILVLRKRGERRLSIGRPHLVTAAMLFATAVFLMLALHVAEIIIWSVVLNHLGLIQRVQDSIYFCGNAYTTLGYGTVALDEKWRNISPLIAFSGLFTFAWTTSSLVDLVRSHSQLIGQLEDERIKELELRMTLRKDEWDARSLERDAERTDRTQIRKQANGRSFMERRKVWKEEKEGVEKLRAGEKEEIEELRRKEREDEEKLGQGIPPPDSGNKK
jgi:hypothetical protein